MINWNKIKVGISNILWWLKVIWNDRQYDFEFIYVIELRKENPEASLNELCEEYRIKKGITVSKSGLKHRFVKIHELREKVEKTNEK